MESQTPAVPGRGILILKVIPMKLKFTIDKSWDETVQPATMDDVRMAILEILSFLPGEANFFLYPNNRNTTLWVENNLMVHFSDEVGTSRISSAQVSSVASVEFVCELYLNQQYDKVYGYLENCKRGEYIKL